MWPGPRPTSVPSFILIHPTVWPQYTNVTDRQRSDSIWRTVLQTVAKIEKARKFVGLTYRPATSLQVQPTAIGRPMPGLHIGSKLNYLYELSVFFNVWGPFVKRFAPCSWSVVCLSVTLVHCDQTVGRIKMKLGTQVGLGPGHTLLDGDPAPHGKGHSNPPFEIYGRRLCLRPYNPRSISIVAKRLYGSR